MGCLIKVKNNSIKSGCSSLRVSDYNDSDWEKFEIEEVVAYGGFQLSENLSDFRRFGQSPAEISKFCLPVGT